MDVSWWYWFFLGFGVLSGAVILWGLFHWGS